MNNPITNDRVKIVVGNPIPSERRTRLDACSRCVGRDPLTLLPFPWSNGVLETCPSFISA